jgi:hypothetical protein
MCNLSNTLFSQILNLASIKGDKGDAGIYTADLLSGLPAANGLSEGATGFVFSELSYYKVVSGAWIKQRLNWSDLTPQLPTQLTPTTNPAPSPGTTASASFRYLIEPSMLHLFIQLYLITGANAPRSISFDLNQYQTFDAGINWAASSQMGVLTMLDTSNVMSINYIFDAGVLLLLGQGASGTLPANLSDGETTLQLSVPLL